MPKNRMLKASIAGVVLAIGGVAISMAKTAQQVPGSIAYSAFDAKAGLKSMLTIVSPDTGDDSGVEDVGPFDGGAPFTPANLTNCTGAVWTNGSLYRNLTLTAGGHLKTPLPSGWSSGLTKYEVIVKDSSGTEIWHETYNGISIQ